MLLRSALLPLLPLQQSRQAFNAITGTSHPRNLFLFRQVRYPLQKEIITRGLKKREERNKRGHITLKKGLLPLLTLIRVLQTKTGPMLNLFNIL